MMFNIVIFSFSGKLGDIWEFHFLLCLFLADNSEMFRLYISFYHHHIYFKSKCLSKNIIVCLLMVFCEKDTRILFSSDISSLSMITRRCDTTIIQWPRDVGHSECIMWATDMVQLVEIWGRVIAPPRHSRGRKPLVSSRGSGCGDQRSERDKRRQCLSLLR